MFPRNCDRVKIAVPVLVVVDGKPQREPVSAYTIDASAYGARLRSFRGQASVGEIVTVLYKQRRCTFRVAWIGQPGTTEENQLGLECLEQHAEFWDIQFRDSSASSVLDDFDAIFNFPWDASKVS